MPFMDIHEPDDDRGIVELTIFKQVPLNSPEGENNLFFDLLPVFNSLESPNPGAAAVPVTCIVIPRSPRGLVSRAIKLLLGPELDLGVYAITIREALPDERVMITDEQLAHIMRMIAIDLGDNWIVGL